MINYRFKNGNVGLHRLPQLVRANFIITMHQHMAHPLYIIPIDFIMRFPLLLCQHINCLSYDFYVFHITIENDGVRHHFFQSVGVLSLHQYINRVLNMEQPFLIPNPLSHISESYRGWQFPRQRGAGIPPQPSQPSD